MSFNESKDSLAKDFITIVSGLPRSGTSMMMKMLDAGRMPLLIDNIRTPDIDNPKGYYEFEAVKNLEHDNSWLGTAVGKAVKIVSPILQHLDNNYRYRIIFMLRNIDEILASQRKMSDRLTIVEDRIKDNLLRQNYFLHLEEIKRWQRQNKNIDLLYIDYSETLSDPESTAKKISAFLDIKLDLGKMVNVVDDSLYRQRAKAAPCFTEAAVTEEMAERDMIIERLQGLGYL